MKGETGPGGDQRYQPPHERRLSEVEVFRGAGEKMKRVREKNGGYRQQGSGRGADGERKLKAFRDGLITFTWALTSA